MPITLVSQTNAAVTRLWIHPAQSVPSPDTEQAKQASEGFDPDQLIPAAIIFGVALAIGIAVRFVAERLLRSRNEIIARLVARTLLFVIIAVGLVYALSSMGIRVGLLLGGLGIGGFALAFAMKDTLENLIAGIILQVRQPFNYDDLVELGEFEGSVDDINLRSVEMTLFTGEKVVLPSSHVLHNPITNLTENGTRRVDIAVGVTYDVDLDEACNVVAAAVTEVEGVLDDPAAMTTFDGFGASTIDLTARYWVDARGDYFGVQRSVAAAIQRALREAGIDMPFPTRTLIGSPPEPEAAAGNATESRSAGDHGRATDDDHEHGDDHDERASDRTDDAEVEVGV